jgi:RNA polymerase sigma-70 factor, ECF subfamily
MVAATAYQKSILEVYCPWRPWGYSEVRVVPAETPRQANLQQDITGPFAKAETLAPRLRPLQHFAFSVVVLGVTRKVRGSCDDSDDGAVVGRVLRGDTDAFRILVTRYQAAVFRLLGNLMQNPAAVDDLAQDVFLSAFEGLASFDPLRGHFSSWLFCIAKHRAINARKKSVALLVEDPPTPSNNHTPADDLVCTRLKRKLDQVLLSLPEEQRTTFVLAEVLGLPPEHVAEIEGCTHSTIRSRLSRARGALLDAIATGEDLP